MTFTRKPALDRLDRIVALLRERPMHKHDLADAIGTSTDTVMKYVRHLHSQRRVYVIRWVRRAKQRDMNYRRLIRVWAAGDKDDQPMPPPIPRTVHYKRNWEMIKANPEVYQRRLDNRRRRDALKKRKPQTPMEWLQSSLSASSEAVGLK